MKYVKIMSTPSSMLAILTLTVSANAATPGAMPDSVTTGDSFRIPGIEELLELFDQGAQIERDREVIPAPGDLGLDKIPGPERRGREIIPDD